MRHLRNLSFILLVITLPWANSVVVRAEIDCSDSSSGPHAHPEWGNIWCEGDSYSCSEWVFDCCGEDFEGDCNIEDCGVILPGNDCACALNIYCEDLD